VPPGFSERCGKDLVLQRYHLAAEPRIVSPPPDALATPWATKRCCPRVSQLKRMQTFLT